MSKNGLRGLMLLVSWTLTSIGLWIVFGHQCFGWAVIALGVYIAICAAIASD